MIPPYLLILNKNKNKITATNVTVKKILLSRDNVTFAPLFLHHAIRRGDCSKVRFSAKNGLQRDPQSQPVKKSGAKIR